MARLLCNKFKGGKDKVMLVLDIRDTWRGNALSLSDQGTLYGLRKRQCSLKHIISTKDLDAYDSDCDDVSNAKSVLMANLSNYGSDVISEVPHSEPYHNDMDNQSMHAMQDFEQTPIEAVQDTNLYAQQDLMILSVIEQMSEQMINRVNNLEKANQEKNNESLTAKLEIYKERVKTFKQRLNIVISSQHAASLVINEEETLILEEDKSYDNQNTLEIPKYFENNDLKAQLQAKDTTICKLKEHIKSIRENNKEEKVKQDIDEIETINIELEHSSSKQAKIVESKIANNSELNHSSGSNATDVPSSSSLVNDSKFLGTVRFRNDQIAKIIGYGDYKLGNLIVLRTFREFYENVGISHQTSIALTPQQNGVVEIQNQTLVKAARIMLIFSKAPLFMWAKAINIACYTQNRSLIRLRYNKTSYELMHDKKSDLSFLYVFGSLCYRTNDSEDLGLVPNPVPRQPFNQPNRNDWDRLFQPMFDEYFNPPQCAISPIPVAIAPRAVEIAGSPSSTTINQDAPSSSTSSTNQQEQSSIISQGVEEPIPNTLFDDPCHEPLHDLHFSKS
ncbi:retrovirus-related pol polyprotein from transposon TNT 1-94 [Tanacetum coccineum]